MSLPARSWLLILAASLTFLLPAPPGDASTRTLRAGLEQNPPLSFIDSQGQPSGLLVDLLNETAATEDWRIEYIPDTFQNCLEKLQRHEIDLMVTIAWSEARAKIYDFNQLNAVAVWGALYAPRGIEVNSYFDLQGKSIAVVKGDIHHQALRRMLSNFGIEASFVEVDDFKAVFEQLRDKTADAGVVGRFFAIGKEKTYNVHATPLIFNPIQVHYATARGRNADLLEGIDRNLRTMKQNPESAYYRALERWLEIGGEGDFPAWLNPLLLTSTALILLLAAFIFLLRRQVQARTLHLEAEIAERVKTARALEQSEQNYRDLVENANAIILRWDLEGRLSFLNDFAERFFGYRKDELIGQSLIGTIVPKTSCDGSDLTVMIDAILKDPEAFAVNTNENVCKDRRRVWISWRNRPTTDKSGRMDGILSVGQDVTEQVRAEQKQILLDRAKDDFISIAAHELRTPLTSIIGFSELLRDDDKLNLTAQQKKDFQAEILNKGKFLARIINDLLDISRIQNGNPLPIQRTENDLTKLTEKIIRQYEILHPDRHFKLETRAANPVGLRFDHGRVTQVLENLLNNAVKYSEAGTNILTTIDVQDNRIEVSISDEGIGMTEEETAHIFDRFYRADQSDSSICGLGIGMSITKEIIESHGGQIRVDSTSGEGTSISFTLPT